jgi:hypothetical protein
MPSASSCQPLRSTIGWVLAQLTPAQLNELERSMTLTLYPVPTPAQRRVAELGVLSTMLTSCEPDPGLQFPIINREKYDRNRPPGALSAGTLVRHYGSWHATCSRAYLINADGTYDRKNRPWALNQPWPQPMRGKRSPPRYTREEVLDGIRACAEALGRRPSSSAYRLWSGEKRRLARTASGTLIRLPSLDVVKRFFPTDKGGFPAARAAAFAETPTTPKEGAS